MCKPAIFDPLEWAYVRSLAISLLPELSFHRDEEATRTAASLEGVDIGVLKDFDWGEPVVYMPPFEKVVGGSVVVAVEGYSARKLATRGIKPDVVVTDLDFEPEWVGAGRVVVAHVHGDNYWRVPKRDGVYTVQTWPRGCTFNISGFTDGDRAVYLAYYMGAERIAVSGFYPYATVKRADSLKQRKLFVAAHLLARLSRRVRIDFV